MTTLAAKYENHCYTVYDNQNAFGTIVFDGTQRVTATIHIGASEYRAAPESATDKNIVLKSGDNTLLKFRFNYFWGSATLLSNGQETGYKIKGKFFKPGTRLVDKDANDLVVVVSGRGWAPTQMQVSISDPDMSPLMVMATLYYHIYASASKTQAVAIRGGS